MTRYLHRAGRIAAAIPAVGTTLCGRLLALAGAPADAPLCPTCERIAARKRWAPVQR